MSKRKVIEKGEIFGDLIVIQDKYELSKSKRSLYMVQCKCGKILQTRGDRLRSGIKKRCKDCAFKLRSENLPKVSLISIAFQRYVIYRCKYNNIDLSITEEDYFKLSQQNCYYCGIEPEEKQIVKNRKYNNSQTIKMHGVDRLDSNIGYHLNNCVPCCTSCNYAKHELTEKQFLDKIIKIYNNMNLNKLNK